LNYPILWSSARIGPEDVAAVLCVSILACTIFQAKIYKNFKILTSKRYRAPHGSV
jgi:hypothetical protein